ncbi:MAG: hypothetical protein MMC33_010107 [Icmadophila ericetorum]|nr:hypothetical protein [Icmadophila ericetorum]
MNRRRRKGARESLARGQFVGASFEESGTHDEAEERAERNTGGGEHSTNLKAVSPLLLQVPVDAGITDRDEDVDDEVQDRWMAQVRGNMRLNRPPARSRRNTLNPIRPSLVGALEFRAILSSLAKAQNTPIPHTLMRRHSDDASLVLSQQQPFNSAAVSHSRCVDNLHGGLDSLDSEPASKFSRARAVSVNDTNGSLPVSFGRYRSEIPTTDFSLPTLPNSAVPQPTEPSSSSPYSNIAHTHPNTAFLQPGITADSVNDPSTRPIIQLSSRLALPLDSHSGFGNYTSGEGSLTAQGHFDFRTESQWRNKTKLPTGIDSSPVTTFPPYYDDETFLPPSRPLSRRTRSSSIGPTFALGKMQKSVSWWPYRALPPPQVIGSILFPTLDSWGDKNIWGKLLAIAAVPSVLLLVVTLPVVELESNDGDPMPSTNDVNLSNTHGTCSPLANPLVIISRPTSLNGDGIGDIDQPYTRITQHNQYPSILINGDNYHSRQEVEDGSLALAAESLPNFENQSENTIHSESLCPVPQNSTKAVDEIPLSPRSWNRWLVSTQVFITPQFLLLVVWLSSDKIQSQISLFRTSIYTLVVSLAIFAVVLLTTNEAKPPRYRFLICFVGFIVSIAWISTIADEVVAVLKALGVIFNISDAILGLTIFAVGNSLGDLVANVTVARLGYPMMALSACFGGPMLNILLGIGISGLYMMIRDGNGRHDRHPTRPVKYKAFQIEVDNTLILSGATLLVTLISLLIAVPLNNWRIDRKIGWGLIILWTISTFSNVILEIAS